MGGLLRGNAFGSLLSRIGEGFFLWALSLQLGSGQDFPFRQGESIQHDRDVQVIKN